MVALLNAIASEEDLLPRQRERIETLLQDARDAVDAVTHSQVRGGWSVIRRMVDALHRWNCHLATASRLRLCCKMLGMLWMYLHTARGALGIASYN
eukprot:scaffold46947_cov22-Tisochrysis_lutea.AAC.1